jgi:hypothetical protein
MITSVYVKRILTYTILLCIFANVRSQFTVQNIGGLVGGSASPQNNGKTVQIISNRLSLCGLLGCSSFGASTSDTVTFYSKVFNIILKQKNYAGDGSVAFRVGYTPTGTAQKSFSETSTTSYANGGIMVKKMF